LVWLNFLPAFFDIGSVESLQKTFGALFV
jgi:hypothetical protein